MSTKVTQRIIASKDLSHDMSLQSMYDEGALALANVEIAGMSVYTIRAPQMLDGGKWVSAPLVGIELGDGATVLSLKRVKEAVADFWEGEDMEIDRESIQLRKGLISPRIFRSRIHLNAAAGDGMSVLSDQGSGGYFIDSDETKCLVAASLWRLGAKTVKGEAMF